jgi:hypothetical protein
MSRLKPRERDAIVQALRAGVVPKLGLRHIQVGRAREIEELVKDMDRIADGGSAIRFIIGEYGSGKTFFMNLIRLVALEKGLVVMFADLAPDRRIHASGGQARGLYAEMARNLSTRTKPDGGALANVVERFVSQAQQDAEAKDLPPGEVIRQRLAHFEELTGGFDFAQVIRRYWEGHETGDDELKSAAIRWLRGEFATKTDARKALGVRTIVDDASVYDHLKLMSAHMTRTLVKGNCRVYIVCLLGVGSRLGPMHDTARRFEPYPAHIRSPLGGGRTIIPLAAVTGTGKRDQSFGRR